MIDMTPEQDLTGLEFCNDLPMAEKQLVLEYFECLEQLDPALPEGLVPLLKEAFRVVIEELRSRNQLFLLAVQLGQMPDPHRVMIDGRFAIEHFREMHNFRNKILTVAIARKIVEKEQSEAGAQFFIHGPMFAGKSKLFISIAKELEQNEEYDRRVHVFTAELINKAYIGTKDRSEPGSHDPIQATPFTLTDLEALCSNSEYLEYYSSEPRPVQPGDTIIIDEAPFITLPLAEELKEGDWENVYMNKCSRLEVVIQELQSKGINVIVGGLSSDYRGQTFELTKRLSGQEGISHIPELTSVLQNGHANPLDNYRVPTLQLINNFMPACISASRQIAFSNQMNFEIPLSSFICINDPETGKPLIVYGADKTCRFDRLIMDGNPIVDLLWKIGISDINKYVLYTPGVSWGHFLSFLSEIDSELAQKTISFGTMELANNTYYNLLDEQELHEHTPEEMDEIAVEV